MTRSIGSGLRRSAWAAVMLLVFQTVAVIGAPAVLAQTPVYALDCDDQAGDDDQQTNAAGEDETYTCTVTSGSDPVTDLQIDAEIISGVNDPDDGATGAPDRNPVCTTGVQRLLQLHHRPRSRTRLEPRRSASGWTTMRTPSSPPLEPITMAVDVMTRPLRPRGRQRDRCGPEDVDRGTCQPRMRSTVTTNPATTRRPTTSARPRPTPVWRPRTMGPTREAPAIRSKA